MSVVSVLVDEEQIPEGTQCPVCGADLDVDSSHFTDTGIYQPVLCSCGRMWDVTANVKITLNVEPSDNLPPGLA
jgi:hypothetical protein